MGEQLAIPEVDAQLRRYLDEPLAIIAVGETVEL